MNKNFRKGGFIRLKMSKEGLEKDPKFPKKSRRPSNYKK